MEDKETDRERIDLGELLDPKVIRLVNYLAVKAKYFSWPISIKLTTRVRVPLQTSLRIGMWRILHNYLTWNK